MSCEGLSSTSGRLHRQFKLVGATLLSVSWIAFAARSGSETSLGQIHIPLGYEAEGCTRHTGETRRLSPTTCEGCRTRGGLEATIGAGRLCAYDVELGADEHTAGPEYHAEGTC